MPRTVRSSLALRACFALLLVTGLIAGVLSHGTQAAGGSKQLQRVKGTVGYSTVADTTDFKTVFGKFDLPDDDFAVTRGASAAVLAMPDSSLISLGENTSVQVGAFDSASASPGSTITLKGGTLRFEVKRPEGGVANYHFLTPTSQVAVRGTVGLLALVNGITTVGCVACAADSITVTVGTQTLTLATGQFIAVSALGAVTTGTLGAVVGTFTAAGVPTTAAVGPAAAGIPAAGAAAAGAVVPVVAGAVAAGAAIGIAASKSSPTPQPSASASAIPVPNATPTGTVNLTGHAAPAPAASRAPAAMPAGPQTAPLAAPPRGVPGTIGRPTR